MGRYRKGNRSFTDATILRASILLIFALERILKTWLICLLGVAERQ